MLPSGSTVAPAHAGQARELRADVLHHDLAVADQLVDVQGDALDAAAQQQHRVRRLDLGRAAMAEQSRQIVQRVVVALEGDAPCLVEADELRPP